jgi:DNA/RNA endonuclease YhcR with UshA esterase domain
MGMRLAILMLGVALAAAAPVLAHHSVTGEYDPDKPVSVKGVVTKVEWTNPHARIYLDVTEANGTVANWNVELQAVSALVRNGWTRKTINVGDMVTVQGIRARTGITGANAQAVVLADGRKVFSGVNDR